MAIIAAVSDRKLKLPFRTHALAYLHVGKACSYSSRYLYPPG